MYVFLYLLAATLSCNEVQLIYLPVFLCLFRHVTFSSELDIADQALVKLNSTAALAHLIFTSLCRSGEEQASFA